MTPEIMILGVLAVVVLMTALNRLVVQQNNWLARGLTLLTGIIVVYAGVPLAVGAALARTPDEPVLFSMVPFVPWGLCCNLVCRWIPPPPH